MAVRREEAVRDHRDAQPERVRSLDDRTEGCVHQRLAARETDLRVAFPVQHLERAGQDVRLERCSLLRVGVRVAVEASEVAEAGWVEVDDAVGKEPRPHQSKVGVCQTPSPAEMPLPATSPIAKASFLSPSSW